MNPYTLAQKVNEKYLQYLKTMFYFKDAGLRKSFEDALNAGHLSNGPYLEATPVFKRAKKTSELFAEILGFQPDEGFLRAIDGDRPLYCHQEDAIRCTTQNKNVVVATGTGSGKTEAFLLPILLHLYREFKAGQLNPGVRALIIYPMNALAFDQRERLGKISARLEEFHSDFRFTFGQYVGDTPNDENDRRRNAREALDNRLRPGELVLREEMRSQPPHILLTNYSMLEFMLLRPEDKKLFDDGNAQWWKFIVLDEAHQYRGTKGMEMGMLLRRLKQRLCEGGRQNGFLCIATSATLSSDTKDKTPVAKFAQDLFGESFEPEHIITGQYEKLLGGNEVMLNPTDYKQLENARSIPVSNLPMELSSISFRFGIDLKKEQRWQEAIYTLLQKDACATSLREKITGYTIKVDELAKEIFPEMKENDEKVEFLIRLLQLLVSAESPVDGSPLLTARFHFFLRSLEGAYLSLASANGVESNQSAAPKILLDRTSAQPGHAFFEIALCRECGQHYFVGKASNSKLQEAIRDPGDVDFGANFFRPIDAALIEQNEVEEFNTNSIYQLCLTCAALSRHPVRPSCNHSTIVYVEQQEPARNRIDQVSKCSDCGYQAADPVREIVHGSDGPNAVIATALVQNLPKEKKKILAFADSRQQAAFFAWYLDDSYQSILARTLILHAVTRLSPNGPMSLNELANELAKIYEECRLFPETMGEIDRKSAVWKQIYSEFLTEETNQSLEGVGLVRYTMKWPSWLDIGNFLNDSPLSEAEKYIVLETMLSFVRSDKAVELKLPPLVNLSWNDLGLFSSQMTVRVGEPHNQRNIRSWDGEKGRRARWLAKVFASAGIDKFTERDKAVTVLRAIWQAFLEIDRKAASPREKIFYEVNDSKRLNPEWWRIQLVENNDTIYQCLTCGRLQHASVKNICNRNKCHGKLVEKGLSELAPNHYRLLYKELNPERLRVEEHTAQLTKEKAREYQRDFRENKIQVLSCSTTFELGVDLGDLDTVFLRNVPPESFNYAQRIGRAGRRAGNIGVAITYCRRNAHDLYHFNEPERMISGKVNPPAVSKSNQKIITRHLTAAALSFFFRKSPNRFECVESYFADLCNPSATKDFRAFLQEDNGTILSSLKSIITDENQQHAYGLHDGTWIEHLTSAALVVAETRVTADFNTIKDFESESIKSGKYGNAQWAQRRANTIAKEDVLSFLSRTVVIPKYGFPVDVVELDTNQSNGAFDGDTVTLERDLSIAIAEFAPTSRLVANKYEWQSYALKKVAEKEWSRWHYARCTRHHRFERWQHGQIPNFTECCEYLTTRRARQYVVPQFGFQTKRESPRKPLRKTERIFSTRPYFVGFKNENQQIIRHGLIDLTKTTLGEMVVLCEGCKGEGFTICPRCGTGFRELTRTQIENGHEDFLGRKCNYRPERFLSLGHDFVTDVMKMTFNKPYIGDIKPQWFAFTLAYSILEGASKVLDVPANELNATVYAYDSQGSAPSIILYDNVPGGAGLVARLEIKETLIACFEAALERVDGRCRCEPETTCYGCLRNYRNQFAHPYLKRGAAYTYLLELLKEST